MSLSSSTLSTLINNALTGDSNSQVVAGSHLNGLCDAIAQGVVNHITSSSIVLPGTFVSPNTGGAVTGISAVTGLSSSSMATLIANNLPNAGAVSGADLNNLATAIATPICSHILSDVTVPALGLVASPPAVTGQAALSGLSGSTLATAIRSSILGGNCGAVDNAALTSLANAIGNSVASHLTGSGAVLGLGFASSPTGGPLTGTSSVS